VGRIQSNVGLITGVPIRETVDKLMAVAARPRDRLLAQTKTLGDQQVAVNGLMALTISLQLAAKNLARDDVFSDRTLTSSAPELLSAAKSGGAAVGSYRFTPVQEAQTHQLLSRSFTATSSTVGAGTLSLRRGGFIDTAVALNELNGGAGVARGKIRITDRSGVTETIDLRNALTVDDVVAAINGASVVRVRASFEGDAFRLTDVTGESVADLQVRENGLGTTATDLGLEGIGGAVSSALGADIVRLSNATRLSRVNDGNGIGTRDAVADLELRLSNGEQLSVDLGDEGASDSTIGDLLETLNGAAPGRLRAEIAADGERIVLIDETAGSGSFTVASAFGGTAAEDLGIAGTASGSSIEGRRLLGGLKTSLLTSLRGGRGLESLGRIQITDRAGVAATVDLAGSESLDEVIRRIASSGAGVTANVNTARTGIEVTDTTGQTGHHLVIANADATATADTLGIAIDADSDSVDSGSLDRQVISRRTSIDQYRNGGPVRMGSFLITDANGKASAINLSQIQPTTVGDVLDAINGLGLALTARINDAGDGISLVDTTHTGSPITVRDVGSGKAATDLGIAGTSTEVDVNGTPTHVLDGSTTTRKKFSGSETLEDLVRRINDSNAGVTASLFREGGQTPYRIALVSVVSGSAGAMRLDDGGMGLGFIENAAARDAVLVVGGNDGNSGLVVTSPSNAFVDIVDGLTVTVEGTSTDPVTVTVEASDKNLLTNFKLFVDKYNEAITKLREWTKFDAATNTTGILFGTTEALRVDITLGRLVSGQFRAGEFRSLTQLGIDVRDDGKLDYDPSALKTAFERDPEALREFFTKSETGFAARLDQVVESLAGVGDSLLVTRSSTLQRRIELNASRLEAMDESLERQRSNLLSQFYRLENTIARLQNNMSALSNIQLMSPLVSRARS